MTIESTDVLADQAEIMIMLGLTAAPVAVPVTQPIMPTAVPVAVPPAVIQTPVPVPVVVPTTAPVVVPVVVPIVTPTPTPQSLLPFVKFFGDPGNGPQLSTQARTNNFPLTPPFFMTGKFVILDTYNFGALCTWGDQSLGAPTIIFALHGGAVAVYAHGGGVGEDLLAAVNTVPALGTWCHGTLVVGAPDSVTGKLADFQIILDGVYAPPLTGENLAVYAPIPIPAGTNGGTVDVTFGSYGDHAAIGSGGDADNLGDGGLRDWAIVEGIPTLAELDAYNTAPANANAIWPGGRVKGQWAFTSIPTPDISGNNRGDLIYGAVGTTNQALPILVTK